MGIRNVMTTSVLILIKDWPALTTSQTSLVLPSAATAGVIAATPKITYKFLLLKTHPVIFIRWGIEAAPVPHCDLLQCWQQTHLQQEACAL
jgi:hypothetical protein